MGIQCVGNSASLKRRFGRGYTLVITAKDGSKEIQQQVDDFVHGMFKTAKLLQEPIAGTSKYEVSRDEVVLSQVFSEMNSPANQKRVGYIDWGFTETTLEEVFLKLALLAHTEKKLKIGRTLSGMAQDHKFMSRLTEDKERNNSYVTLQVWVYMWTTRIQRVLWCRWRFLLESCCCCCNYCRSNFLCCNILISLCVCVC